DREGVSLADLREHRPARGDERVRVALDDRDVGVTWLGDACFVVSDRAHRGRAHVERHDPQAATSSGSSGNSTRKHVPEPTTERTETRPPWASAIAFEITMPRPVPGVACSV